MVSTGAPSGMVAHIRCAHGPAFGVRSSIASNTRRRSSNSSMTSGERTSETGSSAANSGAFVRRRQRSRRYSTMMSSVGDHTVGRSAPLRMASAPAMSLVAVSRT
jgi:hypothetical protein